jgi:hypothetical protein
MENQNNRLITYPSTVEKTHHHTVVLIDCSTQDFMDVLAFLKTSKTDFDVYTYRGDYYDLEWLNYVGYSADVFLINDSSQVKVTSGIRYGFGQEFTNPLVYFQKIEQKSIDTPLEKVV